MNTFLHFPYSSMCAHFGLWKRQPGHAWHVNSGCWLGPRWWLLWGPGRREPGPLRRCPGEAILLRSGPHTDGTSSRGQLSPLHKAPEPPGGGKWHFARWLGSLRLPVTCTTMSAQQTQGCLFPDVVPVPRRLHQPLFTNWPSPSTWTLLDYQQPLKGG